MCCVRGCPAPSFTNHFYFILSSALDGFIFFNYSAGLNNSAQIFRGSRFSIECKWLPLPAFHSLQRFAALSTELELDFAVQTFIAVVFMIC